MPKEDCVTTSCDVAMTIKEEPNKFVAKSHAGCASELDAAKLRSKSPPESQVFGYSQKNYHIADGNLYSVLTPFQARPSTSRPCFIHRGDRGRGRGRRRTRWKLKFHHQALPPEYLDHYEASLAQEEAALKGSVPNADEVPPVSKPRLPQRGRGRGRGARRVPHFIQELRDFSHDTHATPVPDIEKRSSVIVSSPPIYNNLPYMGEMTLDTKPRRGRKPKKADICHLISKNYGYMPGANSTATCTSTSETPDSVKNTSEVPLPMDYTEQLAEQLEPLNLCTRDQSVNLEVVKLEPSSDTDDARESPELPSPTQSGSSEWSEMAGGYVYWPSARVFVHPMALQSQLLMGSPSESATVPQPDDLDERKSSERRKRSAIFIPPPENSTEVSICKFKFTGGAKPSLEEKKMLSVDAGGNFRYYSGTGDKSMRGYEFFSRESLQPKPVIAEGPGEAPQQWDQPSCSEPPDVAKRKRRTRKSLMREKLERTFKEKGFLIQTQQLQSAEGATYCKFRQLRKFTRYLFRSWKDYLPDNLQDGNAPASAVDACGAVPDVPTKENVS